MNKPTEFPHPYVTVDILLFAIKDAHLNLLLVRRSHEPFQGQFALPGGFVAVDESLEAAAKRVISEKARMEHVYLEQLFTFGGLSRDPRGRVISVAYFALVPQDKIKEVDDGQHVVKWFPVKNLPKLAFDHLSIIKVALDRVRAKIGYSSLVVGLLPKKFRLSQLQKVYEIILDKPIDKRNFRKKMASIDIIEPVNEIDRSGGHRPAALFRFKQQTPVIFD